MVCEIGNELGNIVFVGSHFLIAKDCESEIWDSESLPYLAVADRSWCFRHRSREFDLPT